MLLRMKIRILPKYTPTFSW